jgi:hypothetical protein
MSTIGAGSTVGVVVVVVDSGTVVAGDVVTGGVVGDVAEVVGSVAGAGSVVATGSVVAGSVGAGAVGSVGGTLANAIPEAPARATATPTRGSSKREKWCPSRDSSTLGNRSGRDSLTSTPSAACWGAEQC